MSTEPIDPRVVGFHFVDDDSVPYKGSGFQPGRVPPRNTESCEPLVRLSDLQRVEEILDQMKKASRPLCQWMHCLSYNDSYVGEPPGSFKAAAYQLNRLSDPLPQPTSPEGTQDDILDTDKLPASNPPAAD